MNEDIIPNHIGFIVDGNRRWARERGLNASEGHLEGYSVVINVVKESFAAGVKYISLYIFSTENWKRNEVEVNYIMGLVIKLLTRDLHIFNENNIRLKFIGSKDKVKKNILKAIDQAEEKTLKNTGGTLVVCFNYGGQLEIVDAIKKIVQSGITVEKIDEKLVSENIYSPEIPPVDIVVRTSGEQRISNFMLWRVAYSEMLFLDKYWPDMTVDDVSYIIEEYKKRSRRFGG